MRSLAAPFVAAAPAGARIRTRLRVGEADERVLVQLGERLAASPARTWRLAAALAQDQTSAATASAP